MIISRRLVADKPLVYHIVKFKLLATLCRSGLSRDELVYYYYARFASVQLDSDLGKIGTCGLLLYLINLFTIAAEPDRSDPLCFWSARV